MARYKKKVVKISLWRFA